MVDSERKSTMVEEKTKELIKAVFQTYVKGHKLSCETISMLMQYRYSAVAIALGELKKEGVVERHVCGRQIGYSLVKEESIPPLEDQIMAFLNEQVEAVNYQKIAIGVNIGTNTAKTSTNSLCASGKVEIEMVRGYNVVWSTARKKQVDEVLEILNANDCTDIGSYGDICKKLTKAGLITKLDCGRFWSNEKVKKINLDTILETYISQFIKNYPGVYPRLVNGNHSFTGKQLQAKMKQMIKSGKLAWAFEVKGDEA